MDRNDYLGFINCRSVGPGGTSVTFYPSPEGLVCVWDNENCPYERDGVTIDRIGRASDGHNVSVIPWDMVRKMAEAGESF